MAYRAWRLPLPAFTVLAGVIGAATLSLIVGCLGSNPPREGGAGSLDFRRATDEEIPTAQIIDASFQLSVTGTGLQYTQISELPPDIASREDTFSVLFVDREADIVEQVMKDYQLEIDGQLISTPNRQLTEESLFAFHEAELRLGRHTITMRDPTQGDRVLYDGDILVNGLDEVRIIIDRCITDTACSVTVRKGLETVFENPAP